MNLYIKYFILLVISFFITLPAQGRVTYNYTTLRLLDYEQLNPRVRNAIKESREHKYPQEGDKAIAPLRNTLALILSREDNDGLLRKLAPQVISELESLGVFEEVVGELIKTAEMEVKDKTLSPSVRTTALLRLNNLLLTIRPMTLNNVGLAKEVCRLADSNIKVPKEVQRNSRLTTMFNSTKPTDLAKKIMLWYAEKKGKEFNAKKTKGCPYSKRV